MTHRDAVRCGLATAVVVFLLGTGIARAATPGEAAAPAPVPELNDSNSWAFNPPQDKFTGDAASTCAP